MKTAQANNEPLVGKVSLPEGFFDPFAEPETPAGVLAPLPRFSKEQWKALTSKNRWDVLTAMRGPDLKDAGGSLKFFTTAVLRHVTKDVLRQEGTSALLNQMVPFVVVASGGGYGGNYGSFGNFDAQHFFGHVCDAAQILGVPIVTAPPWAYHEALYGSSGLPRAMLNMSKIVNQPYQDHLRLTAGGPQW